MQPFSDASFLEACPLAQSFKPTLCSLRNTRANDSVEKNLSINWCIELLKISTEQWY